MAITPILPKRSPIEPDRTNRRLELRMRTLVADLWRTASNYEVPSSTTRVAYKNRIKSEKTGKMIKRRGKRATGYVRTGTLKKSWSRAVRRDSGGLLGIVKSSGQTAPYNRYIRGDKTQVEWAKQRGWKTVNQIMAEEWPEAKRDFETILKTAR